MKFVVFVSRDRSVFVDIEQTLAEHDFEIEWIDSGKSALALLSDTTSDKKIDLLITDETLPDMSGRELVVKVITQSPMTNCVAISSLPNKEFHDAYEGYGILMQLPVAPGAQDAEKLISHLKKIMDLTV